MSNLPGIVRAQRAILAVCTALLVSIGIASPVSAHTDFDGSEPSDGAVFDGPLSTVTVNFTNPAVESGDGFQLLEPDGTVRDPDSLDTSDGTSFVASFDPPLDAGTYGFRWEVQAGDAHPIEGSFQFEVRTSITTTIAAQDPSVVDPLPTPPPTTAAAAVDHSTMAMDDHSTMEMDDHSTMAMDEFLADDSPSAFAGRAARTMSMSSSVFAAGVVAALIWTVRGRRDEIERLVIWVRLAGLVSITGGLTALAALDEARAGSATLSETMSTKPGVAALMTMTGGLLLFIGFGRAGRIVGPMRSLSSAVAIDDVTERESVFPDARGEPTSPDRFRWSPDLSAAPALAGLALVIGAYWFDGHTVSRGSWIVHAAVNLVHVVAASVWVGGVFAMTLLAWTRRRRRVDTGLAEMVVRFSTIAAISLAALTVAGVTMAWLVLDSFGDVVSTDWGRVLLLKVGVVAVAAGLGGYNHFVLRPAFEVSPDDPDVVARLRRSLLIESSAMVAVIVITAVLVASST